MYPRKLSLNMLAIDKPLPDIQVTDSARSIEGASEEVNRQRFIDQAWKSNLTLQADDLSKTERTVSSIIQKTSDVATESYSAYESVNSFYAANQAVFAAAASSIVNLNGDSTLIDVTMSTFAEYCPVILRGLDSLSQLHPFIGIATKAFSLVIVMDAARRENNKKVIALKMQMQDMMLVLFDLRRVKDPEERDPEGNTFQDRMGALLKKIAEDITECGSACDHYLKKSFVAKTLKSLKYESRLAKYGDKFTKHRQQLKFALTVHTALGVDSANTKLDSLSSQTESLQLTMSSILRKLDTPREKESQAFIENHGGPEACLQDNQLIKELIKISGEGLSSITLHRTGDDAMDMTIAREKLTREYARDLDQAFDKNLQLFQRKMEAQEKQLQTFFQDSLHTEAEHIISALTAGAHDRLVDVDMQALWKDNDWKGSVKARHFVLALQDFYSDKMSGSKGSIVPPILPTLLPEPPLSPVPLSAASTVASADWAVTSLPRDDSWALRYIGVAHVQPILEAVDDDGTGFVSIKEVNTFATSKPNGWSLPVWIAYWAAGWQVGLTQYKAKIHAVIREMYKIIDYDTRAESPQDKRALRANRKLIDQYLDDDVFHRIDLLLRSLHPAKTRVQDAKLKQVIDFYTSSEQIRLEGYLEGVAYDIDTPATVPLVTGPGRIERFIMPFIYLLLKRHLKVFYIARTHVLDPEEFGDLTSSLENVFSALDERIASLEAIFKQTVPDVAKRLGNYAFGLLQLSYGDRLRKPNKNSLSPWEEDSSNIDVESEGEDDDEIARIPLSILKYGVKDTLESQIYKHSISTFDYNDNNPDTSRHFLSGYWAGNLWTQDWEEFYSTQGLFQISITNVNDAGEITGVAEAYQGLLTVSGLITSENHVRLVLLYEDKDLVTCEGSWNSERNVLSGTFTTGRLRKRKRKAIANDAASSNTSTTKVTRKKKETTTFLFTRTPAFAWRFHTPFGQLSTTPRARWAFACNAVLDLVRRRSGSWHYLRNRTGERTRFLELLVRREVEDCSPSNPLSAEEGKEHRVMLATIHPTDARFYYSLVPSIIEATYTDHLDCSCSKCDKTIIQSRLICLTCIRNDLSRGLDFCLECLELSKNTKGYKHVPSHAMLKVDSVILDGLLAWAIPEARHVATRVKRVFRTKQSRINEAQQEGTKDARPKKSKRMETMCCCCGKEVNTPCWVCLFCMLSDGPASWHEHKDHLIRIHDAEEAEELSATDAKLSLVENRLVGVENQFIEFKGVVNERLSQLEDTLQKILLHVVPNDSPSQ